MKNYRYTVITCNFGNYEIMREIVDPLDDVEYLYITDDDSITSKTWKIIYDKSYKEFLNVFDKVVRFRSRVLEYCNSMFCVRVDGSINIHGNSFEGLVNEMSINNSDISFIMSPRFNTYNDELYAWEHQRNVDKDILMDFTRYCDYVSFDYNSDVNNICTLTILAQKNNEINKELNIKQLDILNEIKEFNKREFYYRVDQIVFTYVLNNFFKGTINVLPLHYDILSNELTQICFHNTNNGLYDFTTSTNTRLYIFNGIIQSLFNGFKYYEFLSKEEIIKRSKKIHFNISESFYSDKETYKEIVNSYNKWLDRKDVLQFNIDDGYYYITEDYERYFVNEKYYQFLEDICTTLNIDFNKDKFNCFEYRTLKLFLPKKIIDNICFVPKVFKTNEGYYELNYYLDTSFLRENSLTLSNFKHIESNINVFTCDTEYFKQFKFSFGNFKLSQVRTKLKGDRSLLVITDCSILPFIHILNYYFHTVIVINNYFNNMNYEFLYAYSDITDILILTSTNKPYNLIIDNL